MSAGMLEHSGQLTCELMNPLACACIPGRISTIVAPNLASNTASGLPSLTSLELSNIAAA